MGKRTQQGVGVVKGMRVVTNEEKGKVGKLNSPEQRGEGSDPSS